MGHQDTKLTSMRPQLKELNDIPYLTTKSNTKYFDLSLLSVVYKEE